MLRFVVSTTVALGLFCHCAAAQPRDAAKGAAAFAEYVRIALDTCPLVSDVQFEKMKLGRVDAKSAVAEERSCTQRQLEQLDAAKANHVDPFREANSAECRALLLDLYADARSHWQEYFSAASEGRIQWRRNVAMQVSQIKQSASRAKVRCTES